jgi:hypothetical protein
MTRKTQSDIVILFRDTAIGHSRKYAHHDTTFHIKQPNRLNIIIYLFVYMDGINH